MTAEQTDGQTDGQTDWAGLYAEHVADLSALAGSLSPEQLAQTVPGTPDWTVREVYAHLAGGVADGVAGRTDGAPGEAWTARHVAERSAASIDDLVAELQGLVDTVGAGLSDRSVHAGTVWDIATHHADLHEALGKHVLAEPLWAPVLAQVAGRVPDALAAAAPPYEQFRAVFSRRSRAQLAAYDTGLSAEELDGVGVFGPRDDDQPVAAAGHD